MSLFLRRRGPEKAKHLRGLLRVWLYLAAVAIVFGVFSIRRARAETRDHSLVIGRQMFELAKARTHGTTKLFYNGQAMYIGSSTTEAGPKDVLDRYAAECEKNPGRSPTIRGGDDDEGSVVCFVQGPETKATTEEALASLLQTGELGAMGALRYTYARRSKTGATLVLTAWTDAKFNLFELIGNEDEDCPGTDFTGIPRVPSSVRAISARAEGTPYGVNVYKSKDTPSATLAFYDREMRAADWIAFDPELGEGEPGRAYLKDGVVLTVATSVQPEGNFVALGLSGLSGAEGGGEHE